MINTMHEAQETRYNQVYDRGVVSGRARGGGFGANAEGLTIKCISMTAGARGSVEMGMTNRRVSTQGIAAHFGVSGN
jgi:hypothetical protein